MVQKSCFTHSGKTAHSPSYAQAPAVAASCPCGTARRPRKENRFFHPPGFLRPVLPSSGEVCAEAYPYPMLPKLRQVFWLGMPGSSQISTAGAFPDPSSGLLPALPFHTAAALLGILTPFPFHSVGAPQFLCSCADAKSIRFLTVAYVLPGVKQKFPRRSLPEHVLTFQTAGI